MKFKLFGTEIYISFLFCAVFCLMLCTDKTGLMIPTLLSVALHEAGHLFIMWAAGFPPVSVRFIPASVQIVKRPFMHDNVSLCVAFAGPFFNLSVGIFLLLNFLIYKSRFVLEFSVINFILCFFNLLPVTGLDGGEILFIILSKKHSVHFCETTVKIISFFVSAVFLALGIFLYLKKTFNISFFILSLYIFVSAIMIKE